MESQWQAAINEPLITELWEKGNYFEAKIEKGKKPFSIILPLPNANDSMHVGHAMFIIEDILARYHRMTGEPTLWLPGADHAGIETQFVFEKKLAKEGKSRFDYDRETLYKLIFDFVEENRSLNKFQLKTLGYSLDWSRYHYSMEPAIVANVFAVFRKMCADNLVYRAERIVNYCPHCGTAFSELEIDHTEKDEFLYYLNYGMINIATTRPETIFADVAIAVNPKDKKYKSLVGQMATIPLINKEIPIIEDEAIEIGFGTDALKVTPAHDQTDFEIGERHNLPVISCIGLNGKMINVPDELLGMSVSKAKEKTIELLREAGKLIKIEPLKHVVSTCYRCSRPIEPLPTPQWYVKTKPLAEKVINAVEANQTKFFPIRFKKTFLDWMTIIRDWNISRQIVWGPRIPAWYCLDCNPDINLTFINQSKEVVSGNYAEIKDKYVFADIIGGLQSIKAPVKASYALEKTEKCQKCGGKNIVQETDTFDTWFLSGQWPLNTLGFNPKDPKKSSPDFNYFYPTSVMDTLWDILFFWVARMMMFGTYLTGEVPFKLVHLHSRVVDKHGQKMSKSKGNVINPIEITNTYGADALRMALIFGTAPASDIPVSEEKIRAMRNFANKFWNAARFVLMTTEGEEGAKVSPSYAKASDGRKVSKGMELAQTDREILGKLEKITKSTTEQLKKYRFGNALEEIYQFFWHDFCDDYLEKAKPRRDEAMPTLVEVLDKTARLLHPFAPFVTEGVYQELKKVYPKDSRFTPPSLAIATWPK